MDFSIICLLLLAGLVWRGFARDYMAGVCLSIGILVSCGSGVGISMGALPQITVHRVILVIWLYYFQAYRKHGVVEPKRAPGMSILWLILACKFLSACLSIQIASSFKDWLGFMLEQMIFYGLLFKSIRQQADAIRLLKAAVVGLGIVCVIAFGEYYVGYNIAAFIDPTLPGATDRDSILGTFRHRILLGYAMAMIFPLCLLLIRHELVKRRLLFSCICLAFLVVCYFSNSRGPWAGAALGSMLLGCLGGKKIRSFLALAAFAAVCAIAFRPGIRLTITNLVSSTFDPNSARGESYAYRNELWRVAWNEISKSPERLLFGYGGVSTDYMDLSAQFKYGGSTVRTGYSSWDSQYACDLIELGGVGFSTVVILHMFLLYKMWENYRQSRSPGNRDIQAVLIATVITFLWALTNVAMFSVQLKFLFWLAVGVSFALQNCPERTEDEPATLLVEPSTTKPIMDFDENGPHGMSSSIPNSSS